jgi:superfamily II DNA helicase RecQ
MLRIPRTWRARLPPIKIHPTRTSAFRCKQSNSGLVLLNGRRQRIPTNLNAECRSLYEELKNGRSEEAKRLHVHRRELTTKSTLRDIALTRPGTVDECRRLRGLAEYYRDLLTRAYVNVVTEFSEEVENLSAYNPITCLTRGY